MILRQLKENELASYQSYVDSHPKATPYHNVAWGKAVLDAYGFTPVFFGLYDSDTSKELIAVMPAVEVKSVTGKTKLCSLPYCDLGGILAYSIEALASLKQQVLEHANASSMIFEYRDCQSNIADLNQAEDADVHEENTVSELKRGEKVRMLFELEQSADEQLASFKPKLRSQIKKSIKNGVTSEILTTPSREKIESFYSVIAQNMRDLGSPVHSIEWFTSIFSHYKNNAFLVLVYIEGLCVGGGIVIHSKDKAVIPWASTLRSHNKFAPNMLLYWQVLSEVINRGITNFDFGRSGFDEGTYRFKKQWGAKPVLLNWETTEQKQLKKEVTSKKSKARETIENIWRKLPLGLTMFLGSKIRKFISL